MTLDEARAALSGVDDLLLDQAADLTDAGDEIASLKQKVTTLSEELGRCSERYDDVAADLVDATLKIVALESELAALKPSKFLFSDDFATLPVEAQGKYHLDAPDGAFSVPADPIDQKPALRILIRRDQPLRWNSDKSSGRCKSELGWRGTQTSESYERFPRGKVFLMRRDYMVPSTWKRSSYKFPIWGLHAPPAPRAPLSLNLVGGTAGKDVRCFLWHDAKNTEVWSELLPLNKWTSFAFRVIFGTTGQASTKLFVDGKEVYFSGDSNVYGEYLNTSQGGLYCPQWSYPENKSAPDDGIKQQEVFMRRLRIGDLNNTLEQLLA